MFYRHWCISGAKKLAVAASLSIAVTAQAWTDNVHMAVAQMSLYYLDDSGKRLLEDVYGEDYLQEYVHGSVWPDLEAQRAGQQWQQRFHYVFFELGDEEFSPEKHCPNNQCLVSGILESRKLLLKKNRAASEKRNALNYISHLIADLHQPLNAGNKRDDGGLKILLERPDLIKVNLRWVWEKDLNSQKNMRWFPLSNALRQGLEAEQIEQWQQEREVVAWLMETRTIAIESAYGMALEGKYDASYIGDAMPIFEQQLQKSAVRLALFINELASEKYGTSTDEMTAE